MTRSSKRKSKEEVFELDATRFTKSLLDRSKRYLSIDRKFAGLAMAMVKESMIARPPKNHTIDQAAIHEAGHIVAFELECYGAGSAKIWGSPGGHMGWQGEAIPRGDRTFPWDTPTIRDLRAYSRVLMAGPFSAEIIANDDCLNPPFEIIECHLLTAKAAMISGQDRKALMTNWMSETTEMISRFDDEIIAIANRLKRKKWITYFDCKRELQSIQRKIAANSPVFRLYDDRALQDAVMTLPGIDQLVNELFGARDGK